MTYLPTFLCFISFDHSKSIFSAFIFYTLVNMFILTSLLLQSLVSSRVGVINIPTVNFAERLS